MVKHIEKMTAREQQAEKTYLGMLDVVERRTHQQVVFAILGLVGSGKSTLARKLSLGIGATVIEGDVIRIELSKVGERYEGTRKIAEDAMMDVLRREGNVILDSDHIDSKKRASIRAKVKKTNARLEFIRTHCAFPMMIKRIREAEYTVDGFFKDADTKIVEMHRRTPQHYDWFNEGGGAWLLKKLPFITTDIDTTDEKQFDAQVAKLVRVLAGL